MALRAAYLEMHRRTDAALVPSGVTADQFVVLAALSEGDALTQRELVRRTSSDPNTLRAMLLLLERQQLIERRPHPTDGRARSVSLTRAGRRVFQESWRKSEALRARLLAGFTLDEAISLLTQLRRLAAALRTDQAELPGPGRSPAGCVPR
jgi:MarR family transcriptional regulator, lower aerobic nicotinate degradation pathway regulator